MPKRPNRYLAIYAAVLTAAFAGLLLMGAKPQPTDADFGTINVQRINVREPDGTLRMVISDHAKFPGLIVRGKDYPHPRPQAGMLFYNDEGTEQGGLVFDGRKSADGKISSGLSLTFDRYDQDQQLQLIGVDDGGSRYFAGMAVNDVPDRPITEDLAERAKLAAMSAAARAKLMQQRRADGYYGVPRYFAGKSLSGNSVVELQDAKGRPRLMLMVTPDGKASIEFLGADGKVERTLTGNDAASQ